MQAAEINSKVREAIQVTMGKKVNLNDSDSFIANLGFNSLKMVSLSLALEEKFGRPLLLNEWISQCEDPRLLTVHSLCNYVGKVVQRDN